MPNNQDPSQPADPSQNPQNDLPQDTPPPKFDPKKPLTTKPLGARDANGKPVYQIQSRYLTIRRIVAEDKDNAGYAGMKRPALLIELNKPRLISANRFVLNRARLIEIIGASAAVTVMASLRKRAAAATGAGREQAAELVDIFARDGLDLGSGQAQAILDTLKSNGDLSQADFDKIKESATKTVSRAEAEGLGAVTLEDLQRSGV